MRVLGGASYFSYALEALHAAAVNQGAIIAVLPGDDKPDPGLDDFCTLPRKDADALWRYLVDGGADNAVSFLKYCQALLDGSDKPPAAAPLLKAGLWWPEIARPNLEDIVDPGANRPVIPICFYRALVQSGQTQPVAALADALDREGMTDLVDDLIISPDAVDAGRKAIKRFHGSVRRRGPRRCRDGSSESRRNRKTV